ncbi:MAG: DMT family transporter, partial [Actinomycetota bacterium]
MTRLLYILLPLAAGAFLAAQAPINARLRVTLDSPLAGALVSFLVGTVALLAAAAATGGVRGLGAIGGGPWWAYLGGILGAVFVVVGILATPRVGVTVTFVAVIAGQVAAAAVIDHNGWLGVTHSPITWERAAA